MSVIIPLQMVEQLRQTADFVVPAYMQLLNSFLMFVAIGALT